MEYGLHATYFILPLAAAPRDPPATGNLCVFKEYFSSTVIRPSRAKPDTLNDSVFQKQRRQAMDPLLGRSGEKAINAVFE